MPLSAYSRVKIKRGPRKGAFNHYKTVRGKKKLIAKKTWEQGRKRASASGKTVSGKSTKQSKNGGTRTMAKRGNGSSYSKQNIAIGTALTQIAPRLVGGASTFLPLVGLLPKVPTSLKVMAWGLSAKMLSDYLTIQQGTESGEETTTV